MEALHYGEANLLLMGDGPRLPLEAVFDTGSSCLMVPDHQVSLAPPASCVFITLASCLPTKFPTLTTSFPPPTCLILPHGLKAYGPGGPC